jgi:hypothetical protein
VGGRGGGDGGDGLVFLSPQGSNGQREVLLLQCHEPSGISRAYGRNYSSGVGRLVGLVWLGLIDGRRGLHRQRSRVVRLAGITAPALGLAGGLCVLDDVGERLRDSL